MLFDIALACLIFYTGMLLLVYFLQDRLLYFPLKDIDVTPAALQLAFEEVHLTTRRRQTWLPGGYRPKTSAACCFSATAMAAIFPTASIP